MATIGKHAGYGTIVSITTGDEIMCRGNTMLFCNIAGTATAAFEVKGLDGTWLAMANDSVTMASSGMWFVDVPASIKVRLNVSAWTSGDVDWQIVSNPVAI